MCFGKRARECAKNVFKAEMGEKFVSAAPGDIIIRPSKVSRSGLFTQQDSTTSLAGPTISLRAGLLHAAAEFTGMYMEIIGRL